MYRLLPITVFVFAAGSFASTLDEIPPRKDVPDAKLVPQVPIRDFSKYNTEDAIRIMRENGVVNELPETRRVRRRDLLEVELGEDIEIKEPAFGPWRDLFNGKDIDNWKVVGSALWKVEEGVIVGGQFGDPKRGGLLSTADSFTDFELELEFMIDEHGKYNSGVYLRNDAGTAARTGYQVNIGRGAAGEFCGGVYTTEWLAKGDESDTVRKISEWNKFRILAIGAHVEVDLNGKRIVTLNDAKPDPKFLQKGVIGLQTYGAEGHDGWVKFKNIRIREVKQ